MEIRTSLGRLFMAQPPKSAAHRDPVVEAARELARDPRHGLRKLYDEIASELYAYALWLGASPHRAEDLVQDVFLALAAKPQILAKAKRPKAYLIRTLRNRWIDRHRGERRRGESSLETEPSSSSDPASLLAWDTRSDGGTHQRLDVERALEQLPTEQREVVYLHHFAGFTFKEVGRITRCSMYTAASRYRLALGTLRTELEPTRPHEKDTDGDMA